MRPWMAVLLLLVGLSPSAHAADQQWVEVSGPHFTVLTNANEKQGRRIAAQFERMRAVFHLLMPSASDTAGSPIVVLALRNKADFAAVEPEAYLGKGKLELAGLFERAPDKNYILLRLDADGEHPYATIYHEYTHYMLRNASQWMPLWMNEGLAQFYQNSDILQKYVLVGKPDANDILFLRQTALLPLKTLFAVDAASPYYHEEQKGSVFYAESWVLTHYLLVTDQKTHQHRMQDYAELLAKKGDPVHAAEQAFGNLDRLQLELFAYVHTGDYMAFQVKTTVTIDETAFVSRPVTTADADATRADVMVYVKRTADAKALLDNVLREDPNNALAHEAMGFLSFHEDKLEDARKWYGEAVRLDSKSYLANYYYGVMSMQADYRERGSVGADASIEKSLRNCIALNPGFAPAYDALAQVVSEDPQRTSEAHMLNVQAVSLEPDQLQYRLNAANVLMRTKQLPAALAVLRAAKGVARTPEEAATVQARIAMLEGAQQMVAEAKAGTATLAPGRVAKVMAAGEPGTLNMVSSDGRSYILRETAGNKSTPEAATPAVSGTHHVAHGTIRTVHCVLPSKLVLTLEQAGGGVVTLSTANFFKLEISAVNYTPEGDMNPCTDLEKTQAKIEYADVPDHSVDGQIISIALSR